MCSSNFFFKKPCDRLDKGIASDEQIIEDQNDNEGTELEPGQTTSQSLEAARAATRQGITAEPEQRFVSVASEHRWNIYCEV